MAAHVNASAKTAFVLIAVTYVAKVAEIAAVPTSTAAQPLRTAIRGVILTSGQTKTPFIQAGNACRLIMRMPIATMAAPLRYRKTMLAAMGGILRSR